MQTPDESSMRFGLRPSDISEIISILTQFTEIDQARIFGSRAKNSYREGSDVDIALIGSNISFDVVSKVHALLEDESKMPYLFDIVDYTHLSHKELREHIERVGVIFYERK